MIFPMNDFGNPAKWMQRIVGTGEIVERSLETVKIRGNAENDQGWLTTVDPVNIIAEGILDVEIYADRRAAIIGMSLSQDQAGDPYGPRIERSTAYGVLTWLHTDPVWFLDSKPAEEPASLRIRVDTSIDPPIATFYYDGLEIYASEIAGYYVPSLAAHYVNIYAFATEFEATILDTTTFQSLYVPPPKHLLTINSSPIQGILGTIGRVG